MRTDNIDWRSDQKVPGLMSTGDRISRSRCQFKRLYSIGRRYLREWSVGGMMTREKIILEGKTPSQHHFVGDKSHTD